MSLKKSDYKYIIILIFLIVISLFIYNNLNKNNEEKTLKPNNNKVKLVTNYSRFFTVNSTINKFLAYLEGKDTDSILKILDDEFKTNNNVNSNNVYTFFPKLDNSLYTFTSREMYYEDISDDFIKFYIYGALNEENMDESIKKGNYIL